MLGAGGPPPLRLKDLLELDCDSCSAAGFRCYPRRLGESSTPAMRRLLDSPAAASLRRHHPSKLSSLSRTLSRRFGVFWRRRDEVGEDDAAARGSDSGASSSTSDDSSRRRGSSRCESDSDFSTATSSATSDSMVAIANADEHDEATMKKKSSSGSEADDKEAEQQLSPVAVMDFPFDDDDAGGTCSPPTPSFSLERLQRTKMLRTTQHKIQRSTQELGPVNLETLLAATSDADDVPEQQVTQRSAEAEVRQPSTSHRGGAGVRHDEPDDEHGILALLITDAGVDHVAKSLLVDFFVEMRRRRGSVMEQLSSPAEPLLPREAAMLGDGDVLAAARGWLDAAGSGRWGLNDVLRGGEAVVAEMDRERRWMQVGEEEREVGTVVAGMLADQLVDEVVCDLLLASLV